LNRVRACRLSAVKAFVDVAGSTGGLSPLLSPAWRQHDLHAAVDIEGLGHRLVYLTDREFVGDELFQQIGCLEFVQKTQAARVAGRGMVGHAEQADLVGQQVPAPIDGYVPDIGEHARAAPALAGDYAARGDLHPNPLSSR
jgi:hypothetical protein